MIQFVVSMARRMATNAPPIVPKQKSLARENVLANQVSLSILDSESKRGVQNARKDMFTASQILARLMSVQRIQTQNAEPITAVAAMPNSINTAVV